MCGWGLGFEIWAFRFGVSDLDLWFESRDVFRMKKVETNNCVQNIKYCVKISFCCNTRGAHGKNFEIKIACI